MKHVMSLSALLVLIASAAGWETSAAPQANIAQTAANRHQELVTM